MSELPVKCPTCDRRTTWSPTAAYRPFCSERCRLIDLGAWLTERHAIPGETAEKGDPLEDEIPPEPPDESSSRER